MRPSGRRVLYISYDGVLEPLGESQVVSYLEPLSAGAEITLLSFEKPADLADRRRVEGMRRRFARAGIAWIVRRYRKWPPVLSTAIDIASGWRVACRWARAERRTTGIIHARGYVPALIAVLTKRTSASRFLFDMRGFWVDEKVEAGHWPPGGILFRVGKRCERWFLAEADAIVSLTHAGVRELSALGSPLPSTPVEVIPTCADLARFSPAPPDERLRLELGLDGALVVGCIGTLSNWYLREDTLAYLAWLSRKFDRMKALVVTREDHDRLRADAVRQGLPPERLVLARAPFEQMPAFVRLMSVGLFFIRPCFSKRASAATKLAEFLGCGVPVVINDGIGDSGEIVRDSRTGVVLAETTQQAFEASLDGVRQMLADSTIAERCRRVAEQKFSLERGVAHYAALYEHLS